MTQSEIHKLIGLLGQCGYNDTNKREFKRLGKKFARAIRTALALDAKTADVRYNSGGIAVSGDVTLHTERVYVHFNADAFAHMGIMYRHCNGRKDYGAGTSTPNHWYKWENFMTSEGLTNFVRTLQAFADVDCIANNMRCTGHVVRGARQECRAFDMERS